MKTLTVLIALLLTFSACDNTPKDKVRDEIKELLRHETLLRAGAALDEEPVTVTASHCERSAGGIHDFYSEGDYWWPNPEVPDGPYVRRDGETNPDNFVEHRLAMIRFSQLVGDLASAYVLTGNRVYVHAAMRHVEAWLVDPDTRMNPHLLYAQAIKGRVTGRGIGIIDTIHLIEVAQALSLFEGEELVSAAELQPVKAWFADYLGWLSTHPYGVDEMNAKNNHGTCWVMQVAAFAKFTGNEEMIRFCADRYKTVLLPSQMADDGSFPLEMERTKPYGYALFNLDAMTTICRLLSTPADDLWTYTTPEGKNIGMGVAFMYPYVNDKSTWTLPPDIMFWEEWPVAHPFLLFSVLSSYNAAYYNVWKDLEHFPNNAEVVRNLPIRHPLLWL